MIMNKARSAFLVLLGVALSLSFGSYAAETTLRNFGAAGSLPTATDDTLPLGNGSAHASVAVPNCTDAAGNHLNYTAASNSFSCGTTSSGGSSFPDPSTNWYFFDEMMVFPSTTSATQGNWLFTATGAGTSGFSAVDNGHIGVMQLNGGTGTTDAATMSACYSQTACNGIGLDATNVLTYHAVVRFPILPDGTNTHSCSFGMATNSTTFGNDFVLGRMIWTGAAVRWQLSTSAAGTPTNTTAATGPSANTYYDLKITATTTTVTMFIDGTQVAENTTNIPNSTTQYMMLVIKNLKSAGAVGRNCEIDYISAQKAVTARLF